jgi:hypothetical protein
MIIQSFSTHDIRLYEKWSYRSTHLTECYVGSVVSFTPPAVLFAGEELQVPIQYKAE